MSMEYTIRVTCPDCGTEGDFVIWKSLNTMKDPEAKQKLITGELFRFKCPKCGSVSNVVYPILYHQMEDQIMIKLVTPDEDVEESTRVFDDFANGTMVPGIDTSNADYTFRLVSSQNELREKVMIFDQGLDDRVIELYKLCVRSSTMAHQPEVKIAEMFLEVDDEGPTSFAVRLKDGSWGSMPYQQETYEALKDDLIDPADDGKKTYFVDPQWALEHMRNRVHK